MFTSTAYLNNKFIAFFIYYKVIFEIIVNRSQMGWYSFTNHANLRSKEIPMYSLLHRTFDSEILIYWNDEEFLLIEWEYRLWNYI